MCFFFKQKTAYDMRISDWSSDVCSSDLLGGDIDALGLKIGFFGRAGDIDLHDLIDFGVKRDPNVMDAERLDRAIEDDLVLRYLRTVSFQRLAEVAGRNRAVTLPGVRRWADDDDRFPFKHLDVQFGPIGLFTVL